jgi:hypothetical protein
MGKSVALEANLIETLVKLLPMQPVNDVSNYYVKMIKKIREVCFNNGSEACECKKCVWYPKLLKYD